MLCLSKQVKLKNTEVFNILSNKICVFAWQRYCRSPNESCQSLAHCVQCKQWVFLREGGGGIPTTDKQQNYLFSKKYNMCIVEK